MDEAEIDEVLAKAVKTIIESVDEKTKQDLIELIRFKEGIDAFDILYKFFHPH